MKVLVLAMTIANMTIANMTIATVSFVAATAASANIDPHPADTVNSITTGAVQAKPADVIFASAAAGSARKTWATAAPAATAADRALRVS